MQRIANGAIASRQLFLAHQVLEEAITATSEVTDPAGARPAIDENRGNDDCSSPTPCCCRAARFLNESAALEGDAKPEPLPKGATDPLVLIRTCQARMEARRLSGRDHRQPDLSQRDDVQGRREHGVRKRQHRQRVSSGRRRPTPSQNPPPPPRRPGRRHARPAGRRPAPRGDAPAKPKPADTEAFRKTADAILIESFDVAKKIDRLIWKYRAMVRITLLAADSQQYSRGFELARGIENGESRAEAMLLLAEAQARDDQNDGATASYEEAAKAVATVQQDGLRGVLAGFVVDSLIASGRFQDARKCIVLYPDPGAAAGRAGRHRRVSGPPGLRRGGPRAGSPPRFPKNSAPLSTAASRPAS